MRLTTEQLSTLLEQAMESTEGAVQVTDVNKSGGSSNIRSSYTKKPTLLGSIPLAAKVCVTPSGDEVDYE